MPNSKDEVSKYFSELAGKRKNPYLPFKNSDYAKRMSARAVAARRRQREENAAKEQDSPKSHPQN